MSISSAHAIHRLILRRTAYYYYKRLEIREDTIVCKHPEFAPSIARTERALLNWERIANYFLSCMEKATNQNRRGRADAHQFHRCRRRKLTESSRRPRARRRLNFFFDGDGDISDGGPCIIRLISVRMSSSPHASLQKIYFSNICQVAKWRR